MAKRVLIVDDEDHIRRVIRMTLEAAGYEAGEAADGPRGLEAFGDGSGWDAVLLDQKMPGMDGLETLRHMRKRNPAARVIMVTAYASIELAVDAMKLGATDFVRKPMTPEMLRNALAAALAKPAATSPASPVPVEAEAPPLTAPIVSRVTMNGFRFWPSPDAAPNGPDVRGCRFTVEHPDGRHQDVFVTFSADAVALLERKAERRFAADSPFWTALAERRLNAFLWTEATAPPAGRLAVDAAAIDREALEMAKRWE
jgi:CheY-like chemotaxis protein